MQEAVVVPAAAVLGVFVVGEWQPLVVVAGLAKVLDCRVAVIQGNVGGVVVDVALIRGGRGPSSIWQVKP